MPSMDRHWRWLYGFALVGYPFVLLILLSDVIVALFAGKSLLSALGFALNSLAWSDLSFVLCLLALIWFTSAAARGARQRQRQRARVLAGEIDAMLPVRTKPLPETTSLPDLAREPLRLLWRTRRGPIGVIATNDGLVWVRPGKPDHLLRWGDARLLEVWRFSLGDAHDGYALFDRAGTFIEWYVHHKGKVLSPEGGASLLDMRRGEQTLLALIAERTGLRPHTFVLDLADRTGALPAVPIARRGRLRRIWHWGTLFMLVLAGAPLGVAAAAITLPLTRSLLLNAYVAATIGALGLFLLGFELRIIAELLRDRPVTPPPFIELPAVRPEWIADVPQAVLRIPGTIKGRLLASFIAMLLLGDGYAALRAGFDYSTGGHGGGLHGLIPSALGSFVLVGLLICAVTVFERVKAVVVDERGLRELNGKAPQTLAWDAITTLVAHVTSGKVVEFSVASAGIGAGAARIAWGARWKWSQRPATAALADGDAAELAALVAQRTGLTLTVEDGV